MALRGVPLDIPGLEADIELLKTSLWEYKQSIPWKDDAALLSPIALREECAKHGLTAPKSFAQNDPEAEQFFEDHGKNHPWLQAVREYRKSSKHLSTLETMLKRARPDGWMSYGIRYFGAHTGRFSGDSGLNMQNLPKGLVSGVDVRSKVKAPEGYTFAIVDLSQIEPRCLHWLAQDQETLRYIREIPDLYEAQARAWGLYSGEGSLKSINPTLRSTIKALALGLGYGMGSKKFATVAGVDSIEADRLTRLYRSKNPKITALWRKLEQNLRDTAKNPEEDASIAFPSGRELKYRKVSVDNGGLTSLVPRQGKLMRLGLWGGVCTENCLSGDTEVLTERGWAKIPQVQAEDRVWDGVEWVSHSGVKAMGIKETIECHGVRSTTDHLFLTDMGWISADLACQTDCTGIIYNAHETQCNEYSGEKVWGNDRNLLGGERWEKQLVERNLQLWKHHGETREGANSKRRAKVLRAVLPPQQEGPTERYSQDESAPRVRSLEVHEIEVPTKDSLSLQELRRERYIGLSGVARVIRELLVRYARKLSGGARLRPNRQRIGVLENKLPVGNAFQEHSEQAERVEESIRHTRGLLRDGSSTRDQKDYVVLSAKQRSLLGADPKHSRGPEEPVYDILNCGPRNRFVVRGGEGSPEIIAHNCIQGVARDVFMHHCVEIEKAGIPVVMHVHDEVVCLVPEDSAQEKLEQIIAIMSIEPDWAPGLPLAAEGSLSKVYKK
jgi:hypothetical protein